MRFIAVSDVDNEVLVAGDSCCTTLAELYQCLVDPLCTEVILRQDFVQKFFTYPALCDFVESSAKMFKHIHIHVDDTVYNGATEAVNNLKSLTRQEDFMYALTKNPSRVLSTIQMLCNEYLNVNKESNTISNKLASMTVQLEELVSELDHAKKSNEVLRSYSNDIESRLSALVARVNFRYEKVVKPDAMFHTDINSYNHILYLKEISRVQFTDSLVYYLQEILRTLYNVPVRFVVIEPYYSYSRVNMYEGVKPHWNLSYNDVYGKNVYMAGYQPKVMQDILNNPSHVNFLIILDRGGYSFTHVDGSNVTTIFCVSDLKDLPKGIELDHVISYSANTLYIPMIKDYDTLSREDRIQKYSSTSIVKKLIQYLEEVI